MSGKSVISTSRPSVSADLIEYCMSIRYKEDAVKEARGRNGKVTMPERDILALIEQVRDIVKDVSTDAFVARCKQQGESILSFRQILVINYAEKVTNEARRMIDLQKSQNSAAAIPLRGRTAVPTRAPSPLSLSPAVSSLPALDTSLSTAKILVVHKHEEHIEAVKFGEKEVAYAIIDGNAESAEEALLRALEMAQGGTAKALVIDPFKLPKTRLFLNADMGELFLKLLTSGIAKDMRIILAVSKSEDACKEIAKAIPGAVAVKRDYTCAKLLPSESHLGAGMSLGVDDQKS